MYGIADPVRLGTVMGEPATAGWPPSTTMPQHPSQRAPWPRQRQVTTPVGGRADRSSHHDA